MVEKERAARPWQAGRKQHHRCLRRLNKHKDTLNLYPGINSNSPRMPNTFPAYPLIINPPIPVRIIGLFEKPASNASGEQT